MPIPRARPTSTFPAINGPSFLVDHQTGGTIQLGSGVHENVGQPSNDGQTIPVLRFPAEVPPPHAGEVRVCQLGG